MGYYTLIIPRENAWEIMNTLGELSCLQIVDMNSKSDPDRPYAKYLKRCEDMNYKLENIKLILQKLEKVPKAGELQPPPLQPHVELEPLIQPEDQPPLQQGNVPQVRSTLPPTPEAFINCLNEFLNMRNKLEQTFFEEAETEIKAITKTLTDHLDHYRQLRLKVLHNEEYFQVINLHQEAVKTRFEHLQGKISIRSPRASLDIEEVGTDTLSHIVCVIKSEQAFRMNKMIFRLTRGAVYTIMKQLPPSNLEKEYPDYEPNEEEIEGSKAKTSFLILFRGRNTMEKITRVCESFRAVFFTVSDDKTQLEKTYDELQAETIEIRVTLEHTKQLLRKHLETWKQPKFPVTDLFDHFVY